ncbi:hypothetical protein [Kitasatospora sp. NPDC051914]|uniref:hypothetical protein n=1 Tax=Kitasatospora sp. NPDC051914 TaxID=3154945 RepID=UPI0034430922
MHAAPITHADTLEHGRPNDARLGGEEQAALRRAHDWTATITGRTFAFGVGGALSWVLGHTSDQP